MKYKIYHIPGKKIGCTTDIKTRMNAQKCTEYEILEEHNDIFIASERELELQKLYGYRVDTMPYWQTSKVGNSNTGRTVSDETKLKMSKVRKGVPKTASHVANMKLRTIPTDARAKISKAMEGLKYFNNGLVNTRCKPGEECEGFTLGTLKSIGQKQYNNGIINKWFLPGSEPEGFILGTLKSVGRL
jgi:hypothetical protein